MNNKVWQNWERIYTTGYKPTLDCWPVGSVYISVNNTSPATRFGGTWTAIQNGRFLKTITSGNAKVTGGAASASLSKMPIHAHGIQLVSDAGKGEQAWGVDKSVFAYKKKDDTILYTMNNGEETVTIDTEPPYYTVYMWYRVS